MFKKLILEKLLQDLYVNDLVTYLNTEKLAFSIHKNSKLILTPGKFGLCKCLTNSRQLREILFETENDLPFDVKTTKNILGVNLALHNVSFVFLIKLITFMHTNFNFCTTSKYFSCDAKLF